jgi:hypothetical protein
MQWYSAVTHNVNCLSTQKNNHNNRVTYLLAKIPRINNVNHWTNLSAAGYSTHPVKHYDLLLLNWLQERATGTQWTNPLHLRWQEWPTHIDIQHSLKCTANFLDILRWNQLKVASLVITRQVGQDNYESSWVNPHFFNRILFSQRLWINSIPGHIEVENGYVVGFFQSKLLVLFS